MTPFSYVRPADVAAAVRAAGKPGAKFLAGGTNLVDLMREGVEHPDALVDVSNFSQTITDTVDGGLLIGAGAKNSVVAADGRVRSRYPVLSRALLAGASAQIRNMASVGGNILQRTRCTYFYDQAARCNKRSTGTGCDAREGFNRNHAILGASGACVATHPSDMCVALAALDAVIHVQSERGAREVPFGEFHRLPGDTPAQETQLQPGEMIVAVSLPGGDIGERSTYRKVRDRSSFAFALVSVAAVLRTDNKGVVQELRLAWGGVAHRPWRAIQAEAALKGRLAADAEFGSAIDLDLRDAEPLRDNGFKLELIRRTSVAVLEELSGSRA